MYASMFWVTLAGYSTSFWSGGDTGFHNALMIYVGKVKVPYEWMIPASNDAHNEINDTKGVRVG